MTETVSIGGRPVGAGQPCYVIAEVGINHNGELEIARQLIDAAKVAGAEAVKFQKRTPELCVPPGQRDIPRETPWGVMSYLEYRHKVEFGEAEYAEIDRHCRRQGIRWFASCWDAPSVDFIEAFDPPCYKVASASLTDDALLDRLAATGRPVILSTGMSTLDEVRAAVGRLDRQKLILAHTNSSYPCRNEETNLRTLETLRNEFRLPVGYSGHEVGLQVSLAAATLGACLIERHITIDRTLWGSDQAASVEPHGFMRLVRDIRVVESAMGDGVKRVYESEKPAREKLRGADSPAG